MNHKLHLLHKQQIEFIGGKRKTAKMAVTIGVKLADTHEAKSDS